MKATPIRELLPDIDTMTTSILDTYAQATDDERENGVSWYALAHLFAERLGRGDTERAAGVIAALSPQTSWNENVRLAMRAFSSSGPGGHTGDNVGKARAILRGDAPLDVLGGSKVRAFYRCIVDNENQHDVVIDRHALAIAVGPDVLAHLDTLYRADTGAKILERKGAYDFVSDAYRLSAASLSLIPNQLQAVTWLAHRRIKRPKPSSISRFEVDAPDVGDILAHPEDYF